MDDATWAEFEAGDWEPEVPPSTEKTAEQAEVERKLVEEARQRETRISEASRRLRAQDDERTTS